MRFMPGCMQSSVPNAWTLRTGLLTLRWDTTRNGRLLELLAALQEDGSILIYHAMTPPSKKMMTEIFGPERRGQ